ncbi:LOW QUALITY PROTEIN: hypothetical protein BC938DRAFT_477039 [Jimgerdemannia flammicorona]|uniref:Uncharacterized protein n=1 Tax=Jimgerdemannia flammicorona TaxID=994334 RepID=A0A433QPW5_9FUNG|nr:LOW QUALITY PROTEIN: hypothetical protein BC938DRAFT_477039 [Jimgerdemannia flammicorona]
MAILSGSQATIGVKLMSHWPITYLNEDFHLESEPNTSEGKVEPNPAMTDLNATNTIISPITPQLAQLTDKVGVILNCVSLACSLCTVAIYPIIRRIDRSLDKLSLRLHIYIAIANFGFGAAQIWNNLTLSSGLSCSFSTGAYVFFNLLSVFLATCLDVNLQIVFVHKNRTLTHLDVWLQRCPGARLVAGAVARRPVRLERRAAHLLVRCGPVAGVGFMALRDAVRMDPGRDGVLHRLVRHGRHGGAAGAEDDRQESGGGFLEFAPTLAEYDSVTQQDRRRKRCFSDFYVF